MKLRNVNRGFSLIEVAIAVGIAVFCIIALLGLLPVSLNSVRDASEQTHVTNLARALQSDLTAAQGAASPNYELVLTNLSTGTTMFLSEDGGSTSQDRARYRVWLRMSRDSSVNPRAPYTGIIRISWPAGAEIKSASGYVETFVAINNG